MSSWFACRPSKGGDERHVERRAIRLRECADAVRQLPVPGKIQDRADALRGWRSVGRNSAELRDARQAFCPPVEARGEIGRLVHAALPGRVVGILKQVCAFDREDLGISFDLAPQQRRRPRIDGNVMRSHQRHHAPPDIKDRKTNRRLRCEIEWPAGGIRTIAGQALKLLALRKVRNVHDVHDDGIGR